MKKSELVFSTILIPVDYCMVVLAGLVAYYLRFTSFIAGIRPVFYDIAFRQYFNIVLMVAGVFLIIFALIGLYAIRVTRRAIDEFNKIFVACTASIAFIIIVIFFQRELFSSRFIILSAWILSVIFVGLGRLIVRLIQHAILKKGIGVHFVIIVGQDATTEQIVGQIYQKPSLGYKIVERYNDLGPENMSKIRERLERNKIDEIMQADSCLPKEQVLELKDICHDHHVIFKYVPDLFETQAAHIDISTIADVPVIEVKRTRLDGWGRIFKRAFDVVFSFLFLIILSPIFFLITVIIKIDSVGPVFARLERVGEKGEKFILYKFRSMVKDAHALKKNLVQLNERADGPLFKIKNDPRITRVGRFIRLYSLDELPQLFNVFKGEMSLVGPRPHEPEEVAKYDKYQRKLLTIKPGMTGLAQISGRSDLKFDDEAKLDVYYIENWSPKLDWQIIFKTPRVVFAAKSSA